MDVLSDESRSKSRRAKTSQRRSRVESDDDDEHPPRHKRSTKKVKQSAKTRKQKHLDSSGSESENDLPPPKKKRRKGPKDKSRESTARGNVNACVRTAVHDIHPNPKTPGRFMYWDPTVPTKYPTVACCCAPSFLRLPGCSFTFVFSLHLRRRCRMLA